MGIPSMWPKPSQSEALSSDGRVYLYDYPDDEAFIRSARELSCNLSTLKAIGKVEAGAEGAFLEVGGRPPVILFEPHIFHRLTGGVYDGLVIPETEDGNGKYPKWAHLSYPSWKLGWYGTVSVQHMRLDHAVRLDRTAALMSASWGLFQILGENYKRCECSTVQEFVNMMYRSANDHLSLLCRFIRSSPRLITAVRSRDAVMFARFYNGLSYSKNQYDKKLIKAGF